MASSSKRKTTAAKLNRENKLRERKREKEMRKETRKREGPMAVEPEAGDDVRTAPVLSDAEVFAAAGLSDDGRPTEK